MTVMAMPAMTGGMWAVLVAMTLVGLVALAWSQDIWPTASASQRMVVTAAAVLLAVLILTQTTQAWYYDTTAYCAMNSWWDWFTC